MDYSAFERQVLGLIFQTNLPITPVHVAFHVGIPVAEAREYLDAMLSQGILELESDEGGRLVYACPHRPPIETLPAPKPPAKGARRRSKRKQPPVGMREGMHPNDLVPVDDTPMGALARMDQFPPPMIQYRYSPAAAAALSLFLPGSGQMYSGRLAQGIGWMFATGLGYLLFILPGLVLHVLCVVNAAAVPVHYPQRGEASL